MEEAGNHLSWEWISSLSGSAIRNPVMLFSKAYDFPMGKWLGGNKLEIDLRIHLALVASCRLNPSTCFSAAARHWHHFSTGGKWWFLCQCEMKDFCRKKGPQVCYNIPVYLFFFFATWLLERKRLLFLWTALFRSVNSWTVFHLAVYLGIVPLAWACSRFV